MTETTTASAGEYIRMGEAARILDADPKTVRRLATQGCLGFRQYPGGHFWIRRADAERLARESTRPAVAV